MWVFDLLFPLAVVWFFFEFKDSIMIRWGLMRASIKKALEGKDS